MENEKEVNKLENELNQFLGLGQEAKETLKNYLEFASLKQEGKINGIGNFNLFIKCSERYSDAEKLIDFIYKILRYNNTIDENDYYIVKQADIVRGLPKIKQKLIIVGDYTNFEMMSTLDILPKFIQNSDNKVFVLLYRQLNGKRFPIVNPIEEICKTLFLWNIEIREQYTKDEIEMYIKQRLKHNKLRISNKCSLIDKLAKEDLPKIDKELLYITVKAKANHKTAITDALLEKINRPQYISKSLKNKSALEELDQMIGLNEVKAQIKQIVNYIKVNKSRGNLPMLHMLYKGNPGTGKSVVAKIVGKILKENGILPEGNFIEATRTDLVAEYVGQTGPKTRAVVQKALGGCLFIDERI